MEKPGHKCGIYGMYGNCTSTVFEQIKYGLEKIQHRGRECAGISYFDEDKLKIVKGCGLVHEIINETKLINSIQTNINGIIGHVRYSTTKNKESLNGDILPLHGRCNLGNFSLSHNGNIVNMEKWKEIYELTTNNDTEILVRHIEQSEFNSWEEIMEDLIQKIAGVYCVLVLTKEGIYFCKDRYGFHPLCVAYDETMKVYHMSSESCSFDTNLKYLGEVKPGLVNYVKNNNITNINLLEIESVVTNSKSTSRFCLFEYIYFMNENSKNPMYSANKIEDFRYKCGEIMGKRERILQPARCLVMAIPNTPIPSAKGFAKVLNVPYNQLIQKETNCGRSFILKDNQERIEFIKKNIYILNPEQLQYKVLYLIDDSIVRGNTMINVIKMLKKYNPMEIHLRIMSPPVIDKCYYGIDIPTKEELVANDKTIIELEEIFGVTSLRYISMEMIEQAMNISGFCSACFTGKHDNQLLDW